MRFTLTAVSVLGLVAAAACSDIAAPPTALAPVGPSLAKAAKITICHAAGRDGTTHYIAITVSGNATAGHFDNNGTPKAGHEDDYIATDERPCNAPPGGQLQVCVNLDPGGGLTPGVPPFSATLTAAGTSGTVLSQTFSATLLTNTPITQCSAVLDVAVDTYQVDEPAPGVAENPAGTGNGEWFIRSISGTIDGSPTVLLSTPGDGVIWSPTFGRGRAGTAAVPVQASSLSVVTFFNRK